MITCLTLPRSPDQATLTAKLTALALLFSWMVGSPAARGETLTPVTSFTARLIGPNVLVGAPDGTEGTAWKSNFLSVKEGTSDRVVFEYDLAGRTPAGKVLLDFNYGNLDEPNWTQMSLYAFNGNGLANAADYYRIDQLLTTFTDHGAGYASLHYDATQVFNSYLSQGRRYLGFVVKNTIGSGVGYSRYDLSVPELSIVPEPSTLLLGCTIALPWLTLRKNRGRGV
jgi:hypothetical protein